MAGIIEVQDYVPGTWESLTSNPQFKNAVAAQQQSGILPNFSANVSNAQPKASFLNTSLGSISGEGSWLNNPNATGIWGNVGNTLGSLTIGDIGSGIFNGLSLYNTFKANDIAQQQLNLANQNLAFQKNAYYKNLGNQISQYNARVEDIGNTRYKMTGDSKYLDQANERKLHL